MTSPPIKKARGYDQWIRTVLVLAMVGVVVSIYGLLRGNDQASRISDLSDRLDNVTVLAGQNQAQAVNNGGQSIGPPAASVASGKAAPPPTEVAPTTPTVSGSVQLPASTDRIVQLVLARIPKPKNGTTPSGVALQHAIEAVLKAHPEYTKSQIDAAVAAYLKVNPPKKGDTGATGSPGPSGPTGSPGVDGSPGLNGANGQNGLNGASVTGAHICQTDDDPAPGCGTADATGHLVFQVTQPDGSVVYYDAGAAPRGLNGAVGAQGPQGDPGPTGEAGPSGPAGPQCPDGYTPSTADQPLAGQEWAVCASPSP
jgi:hypothetical protein